MNVICLSKPNNTIQAYVVLNANNHKHDKPSLVIIGKVECIDGTEVICACLNCKNTSANIFMIYFSASKSMKVTGKKQFAYL